MLKKILFIIMIIFSIFCLNSDNVQSALKISLTTAKNRSGKVSVNLYLRNNSVRPVDIYQQNETMIYVLGYYLNFDIYHNDGKLELTYGRERVKFPFNNDFITLKPSDMYTEKIELSKYYNIIGSKENEPWPKGEYKIICNYNYKYTGTKYGQNLWEGFVNSDTLKIVVE